ncbi:hypothetical protein [Streptococcus salivarius]|jgi:hypothetical protein|uniref:Uncharacterized protein n=1 Tax=Streptococcus salivarius TaxID=1304 RepID=A0AB35ITT2_STRSL|nr:hypothetical protein [Streptococcus salivarius]MBS6972549.1 hypothetical protein [Streptococcus salivarius]MCB7034297.1 hypothetical protein [Streptococcus salivarius]MDB8603192.1 hypothetical protein [Streptococcus salivarius]MDB8605038.1 hypothetical protein [Streptococcus salivarius]MDB8606996.1 hypothetical protein [Streptococcus salivarius]
MELSADKRDKLTELLSSEYTIPEEYIDCVKVAVKQYSTKNYSDETIDNLVRTPQSLSKGLALLRERNGKNDLSLFRGIISEWLVCAEYNALKNKGSVVMTITNPDSSSKADLLHIINTGNGFKVVPGPDVKSGGSTYVFNQWKKIVNNRYEIPMVDIDGILTTESGLKQLTKKQHAELEELYKQYPNKRPVTSSWDGNDINRVIADYLKFVEFGTLPSIETSHTIKDINVNKVKLKLYSDESIIANTYSWTTYSEETKKLFQPVPMSLNTEAKVFEENLSQQLEVKQALVESNKILKRRDQLVNIGKKMGHGLVKGIVGVGKFAQEHPEVTAIAVEVASEFVKILVGNQEADTSYGMDKSYDYDYSNEYENDLSEEAVTPTRDIVEIEEGNQHNYPEDRNSPRAHPMRRKDTGEVYAVRGGTEEERKVLKDKFGLS